MSSVGGIAGSSAIIALADRIYVNAFPLCPSDTAMEEFKAEACILSNLRHPNIVQFFGVCMDSEGCLLVTELCVASLASIMRGRGALPRSDFFSVSGQIFSGLSYLHGKGVAHLDVRVPNLSCVMPLVSLM